MVVSMTGFGRSRREASGFTVEAEIKSVNHRYFECAIRLPRPLARLEDSIKKRISQYIKRGRADVLLTVTGANLNEKKISINWTLLDSYAAYMQEMKDRYGLGGTISAKDMISLEEVICIEEAEGNTGELAALVLEAAEEAASDLRAMREAEGRQLEADLCLQLDAIVQRAEEVRRHSPRAAHLYKERLQAKLREAAKGLFDEARLLSEVAVFADKTDINEELTRLESHIHLFRETLGSPGHPVGRKLDFILQEMNREINTIGSKANDAIISANVVEMKCSLEKMKEQVQNIE